MSGPSAQDYSPGNSPSDTVEENHGSAWGSSHSPYKHQPPMVAPGDAQAHHGPENPLNFQHHFNSPQHPMGTQDGTFHYGINEHPSAFSTQYNGSHFLPSAHLQQSAFGQSTPPHYIQPDFNNQFQAGQCVQYPGYQHQPIWHQSRQASYHSSRKIRGNEITCSLQRKNRT